MYAQALFGSLIILLFLLVAGTVKDEGKYLLIVRFDKEAQSRAADAVGGYFGHAARLRAENLSARGGELIYEIGARTVRDCLKKHSVSVTELLLKTEGVESANLVHQTDDISR